MEIQEIVMGKSYVKIFYQVCGNPSYSKECDSYQHPCGAGVDNNHLSEMPFFLISQDFLIFTNLNCR